MREGKTRLISAAMLIYAGLLVYLFLTVLSVSDRHIIIAKTVHLPILNLDIPLTEFFMAVPFMAILLYICLHLFLNKYKYLNKYKTQAFRECAESRLIEKLARAMTALFLWGSLPAFMFLLAFKYVKTHEPVLSYVIGLTPILGTLVVLGFWKNFKPSNEEKSFSRMMFRAIPVLSVIAVELVLLLFLIPWAGEGLFPRYFAGRPEDFFRRLACADLSNQRLVTEPVKDSCDFSWGNFARCHLEGAYLRDAVLKRADLKRALLRNADMAFSVLEEADLSFADLFQVNFWNANLRKAHLLQANLFGAFLRQADLQEANFKGANLQYARLFLANFKEADLSGVDARFADFWTVNFQGANLSRANLEGIFLNKSNLARANLREANLQKTSLWKTILRGTNFEGADLRGVRGLEIEQLAEVNTLYKARLDQELLEQIREKHPQLLEKPEIGK